MKYYKIDIKGHYREVGRIASDANGDNVPNSEILFRKMKDGKKSNLPVLDYFFLQSFDKKEFWEWILCDVYSFTHNAGWIRGWFISQKLKLLLDNFNLPNPYYFYPSKLLYKGEKLDYCIFQFTGDLTYKEIAKYIDYKKSRFLNPSTNAIVDFVDIDDYSQQSNYLHFEKKIDLVLKKIVLEKEFDFFPTRTFLKDDLVSEQLKNAMEENGIEGFEFSELDYEVVVEK
jgi:hypothetical protein